jgi:hypothetical protein
MTGRSRWVAVMMASVISVSPVFAQPKPPTEDQKQKVADLANKATAKGDKGEHVEAADLYLEAYKVYPLATMLSNAAAQYQKAKKPVEALRYFCMYLEKDPAGGVVSYATAQAKVLQSELGNTNVDPNNPCVVITPPPVAPPLTGGSTGSTGPGPGPEGGGGGGTLNVVGMVTGAVGLAGLAAGIVFSFKARAISNQITNHNPADPWPSDIKELEERGEAHEKKQIGFLVAGGALAVAGAVMIIVSRSKEDDRRVSISPIATGDTFGVSVGGGF